MSSMDNLKIIELLTQPSDSDTINLSNNNISNIDINILPDQYQDINLSKNHIVNANFTNVKRNKIDLSDRRKITKKQGEEFASSNNLVYFECSAANNIDLDKPFLCLSKSYHEYYQESVKVFKKTGENTKL
jgi:Leucine-rich repeat (LRR) protein